MATLPKKTRNRSSIDFLSPFTTLEAIKSSFSDLAFVPQRLTSTNGKCLWTSGGARNETKTRKLRFERDFSVYVSETHPYIEKAQFKNFNSNSLIGHSDLYLCAGNKSIGSGRSVFFKNMQIKGVGRTSLASNSTDFHDSNGQLSAQTVFEEIVFSHWIGKLYSNKPIQNVALLQILYRGQPKLLLLREGSPLRLGHLILFSALSEKLEKRKYIQALWKYFLLDLFKLSLILKFERLHREFRTAATSVIRLTMTEIAESRIFGVNTTNWGDNWDLMSRCFDLEESSLCFETMIKKGQNYSDKVPRRKALRKWTEEVALTRPAFCEH